MPRYNFIVAFIIAVFLLNSQNVTFAEENLGFFDSIRNFFISEEETAKITTDAKINF